MNINFAIILYFLTFLISVAYSVITGWYSSAILWTLLSLTSIIYFKQKFKKLSKEIIALFLISFSFYSLFMFLTNFLFVDDPSNSFFLIVDSLKFWNYSDYKINSINELIKIFKIESINTVEFPFYQIINLFLAFFAQIFDVNNILIHKVANVFTGAFSIPYIYLIFLKYFDKLKSYKYVLIYSILSFTCIYSSVFFRDSYVTLFYILGTYLLVYYKTTKFIFVKLLLIFILLLGFRLEHGFFFITFIFTYFYLKSTKIKSIRLLFLIILPLIMVFIMPVILSKYQSSEETYSNSINTDDTNSAGSIFAKAPVGVKNILMAVNSQLAPAIPFWRGWFIPNNSSNKYRDVQGYYTPLRFMEGIGAILMVYSWVFIITGFRKGLYRNIPPEIKYIFFIAILLLLTATTVINVRRIYCVYPVIYLFSIYSFDKFSIFLKKRIILNTSILLVLIHLILFILQIL